MFLLFVLSLFHRCADGSWAIWLLPYFPIMQVNGLVTSSAALKRGKPNMKGGTLLVLHMPGQNHFVYPAPGFQHLVCCPRTLFCQPFFLLFPPGSSACLRLACGDVLKACAPRISNAILTQIPRPMIAEDKLAL